MKRLFVLVCALGLWAAAWAAPEVNIVPKPLNVETGDGSFTVDAATVVTVGRDASLRSVGELFAAMIEPVTGRAVKVKTAADGAKIDLAGVGAPLVALPEREQLPVPVQTDRTDVRAGFDT